MSGRRGLRARSGIDPGTRVGVTAAGAAWLGRLRVAEGRQGGSGRGEAPRQWARERPEKGGAAAIDRGRLLAEDGAVGVLSWEPGRVSTRVEGEDHALHAVTVRVERLELPAWRSIVEAMARAPRLLAAVLDGELPDEVVAAAGGLDQLVPSLAAVRLTCACTNWAGVCEHGAAVWYVIAHAIDERPARLLELRGHDGDLVGAVRRRALRNRTRTAHTPPDPGVDAVAAFARVPFPLPAPPVPPVRPGTPEPVPPRRFTGFALRAQDVDALAVDAARRAWELATGAGDGGLGLDADTDLARRVAPLVDDQAALIARARRADVDAWVLARLGLAWRAGGAAAVDVLLHAWSPPDAWLTPGAIALRSVGPVVMRRNRITTEDGRVQLRLGRDRRWYVLTDEDGTWVLRELPGTDPAEVLRGAGVEAAPAAAGPEPAEAGQLTLPL